jgi:hypothetical protein
MSQRSRKQRLDLPESLQDISDVLERATLRFASIAIRRPQDPLDPPERVLKAIRLDPGATMRQVAAVAGLNGHDMEEAINELLERQEVLTVPVGKRVHLLPYVRNLESCALQAVALRDEAVQHLHLHTRLQGSCRQQDLIKYACEVGGMSRTSAQRCLQLMVKARLLKARTCPGSSRLHFRPLKIEAVALRVLMPTRMTSAEVPTSAPVDPED